jgi:hypothetical protein
MPTDAAPLALLSFAVTAALSAWRLALTLRRTRPPDSPPGRPPGSPRLAPGARRLPPPTFPPLRPRSLVLHAADAAQLLSAVPVMPGRSPVPAPPRALIPAPVFLPGNPAADGCGCCVPPAEALAAVALYGAATDPWSATAATVFMPRLFGLAA